MERTRQSNTEFPRRPLDLRRWAAHFFALLMVVAFQSVSAATRIWTGAHVTSSDWSRNANWDTIAPANGDTVVFPAGAARPVNTNDIAGLQLAAIRFIGAGGGYTLRGSAVTVSDRISAENTAGANTINFARITLDADTRFGVTDAGVNLTIDSEVRLSGNDLTANTTGTLVLRGVITGDGNLFKIGDGLLTLSGTSGNTFTGDVFVNAGSLIMGKTAGLAVPGRLVIGDGAGGGQADRASNLADEQVNDVVINSSGVWSLGNFVDEVSSLTLNEGGDVTTGASGKLRLGSGGGITVTPSADLAPDISRISGFVDLASGTHVIAVGNNLTAPSELVEVFIDAVITGPGLSGITKEGPGGLQLSGNNTFGGQVIVNEGELRVDHASALGGVGTIGVTTVNNDANLRVTGVDVGDEVLRLNSTGTAAVSPLLGHGSCSWSGDIVLQSNTRIGVTPSGTFTLSGVISGTGNITKVNTGTLRLSGAEPNTFNGDLLVNAGTVELDKGTIGGTAVPGRLVIGDGIGGEDADVVRHRKDNQVNTVTINGSGRWDLGPFDEEISDLVFNEAGRVTTDDNGLLRLGIGANVAVNSQTTDLTIRPEISGQLELMFGSHTFNVSEGPQTTGDSIDLFIDASIRGVGALLKTGAGDLALYGSNSFAGTVTVDAGSLWVTDSHALGSTISGTRVNNDASLQLSQDVAITNESLVLNSVGQSRFSADPLRGGTGSNFWSGPITLLRDTIISVQTNETLHLSGVISGAGGVIKESAGTLIFSGNSANSYAGSTLVNQGRLQLNKAGINVAVPGMLTIGDGTGGSNADVVECLSVNEIAALSVVSVSSSGQFIARQEQITTLAGSGNVTVSGSLNAGGDSYSVFEGVMSGPGAFNKTGPGTLLFTGNNTYTGGTGVGEGTLLVNGQQPSGTVLVQPSGKLGGFGRLGNVSTFAGGATLTPGNSPGRLITGNLQLGAGTIVEVEFDGPVAGSSHDQVRVFGTVNLGGATLQATLNFIPTLDQPLVLIDNDGTDAVVGQFNGLAEGARLRLNQVPFVISYLGGDGNDVTLTATNTSISVLSTRIEAGNGNGVIDANECNHLFVALMNETTGPLAVSQVVLDSLTPGVVVTQQRSDYANFPGLGIRTNEPPFQFRTGPDFECGRRVDFALTITVTGGGGGTFTIPFSVPSGGAGVPVVFNNGANMNLVDQGQSISIINVSGAATHVGKVTVSLHITHPSAGDLDLRLRSPAGTIVPLALNLGGTGDNYGSGCGNQVNRTTFDDAAAVRIAAGTAPFIGSFTPDTPLAGFLGEDPNGDWQLLISDTVAGDTGELRCWSLLLSPPECSDGGGACETCVPALSGRFSPEMPSTTMRLVRDRLPSGCGSAKDCPTVTTGPNLFYRVHFVTNSGPATCVSAVLVDLCRTSNLRLHAAAYVVGYDPAQPCKNYLGDTGTELTSGSTSFSFSAPENAVIAIVVSSPVAAAACVSGYLVQLYGLPCPPPTLRIAETGNPDEVRLFWSTAYPDFNLQRVPALNGTAPYSFVNVPFMPFVVNGDYSVTNATTSNDAYYRLSKP